MNNLQDIHIGSIIEKILTEKSISVAEFARKINRDRTTVYTIFKRKSIDIDLLIAISEALQYDFIHQVYFPHDAPKIQITIEVQEDEIEKLNLPDKIVSLVKTIK